MTTIRVIHNKENPYVQISRKELQNDTLSFEATGVWTKLLSRPDDWQISIKDLQKSGRCGEDRIYRILNELIDAGYVYRHQERILKANRKPFFGKVQYYIFESPEDGEEFKKNFPLRCFQGPENDGALHIRELVQIKKTTCVREEKPKEEILTFGGNVFLTKTEHQNLINSFGKDLVEVKIAFMKSYKKKFDSCFYTLGAWCIKQQKEDAIREEKKEVVKQKLIKPKEIEKDREYHQNRCKAFVKELWLLNKDLEDLVKINDESVNVLTLKKTIEIPMDKFCIENLQSNLREWFGKNIKLPRKQQ